MKKTIQTLLLQGLFLSAGHAAAQSAAPAEQAAADAKQETENRAVHGQATTIAQKLNRFRAPYSGENSLPSGGRTEETTDITLFAGWRLTPSTEVWINPEIDQGFGVGDTLGAAGYLSGGAYKLGQNQPYLRLPRVFVRHELALGTTTSDVAGSANQLAGKRADERITLTAGRFSVVDIFDNNQYAHDPRGDFLNWSVIDAGAFDYAADVWGYTNGAVLEWNSGERALRSGVFQLSPVPNAKIAGVSFDKFMWVTEFEQGYALAGRPGKLRALVFLNRSEMGRYRDAVALAAQNGQTPDTGSVRRRATQTGWALNWEQEVADNSGVFLRASANRGEHEAYEFTDIQSSLSGGTVWSGQWWGRPADKLGLAFAVNALSADARAYFAAGGKGLLIGDGRLNYGREQILETFYRWQWSSALSLSADLQHIRNPAYNRDRGPVRAVALRVHAEF